MASGSSPPQVQTIKVGANGSVIRILGKRKAVEEGSAADKGDAIVVAEKFYTTHLSRIHDASRNDKRRKDAKLLAEQREEKVRERLAERGECDLVNLTCHINRCYRGFESVRVLAWHMSYSHTDESERTDEPWTCLVCGRVMSSVKGKNSHLATGHRDLCVLHNAQCIQQRAPKTEPIARHSRGMLKRVSSDGVEDVRHSIVKRYLLDDELVYDEDSDFEEDVSVPEGSELAIVQPPRATAVLRISPTKRTLEAEPAETVIVVDDDGKS